MTRATAISLIAVSGLLAGCKVSAIQGQCRPETEATDCQPGSKCDTTQAVAVCVVPQGACYPACASGFACVSGSCISAICAPPCGASQLCDPVTVVCKDVTVATVEITSPALNAFTGLMLQTTATARAPGGVNGVDFQILNAAGTVLAQAAGVAVPAGSANFAATVTLSGNPSPPDGMASLVAIESYPSSATTLKSLPLAIRIDLTPPVIGMGTFDGRTFWLGPAHTTASVTAIINDGVGVGVDPAQVTLTLLGGSHTTYRGKAGSAGLFTFAVLMADLGVAAGSSGTVPFKIDAKDLVGNASPSLTGLPTQVLKVDQVPPLAAITADASWHSASEVTVAISGTAGDAQSGLLGGAAKAVLTGGTLNQTGTLTATTFSFNANLTSQTFAAAEMAFPITVTVTDNAGNATAVPGSINVDNKPPVISAVTITTAADATANGHGYYVAGAGSLTVTATIADGGAGVATGGATPCLQVGAGSCVAGSRTSGNATTGGYTFALPRSAGTGNSGATPIQYTIKAQDAVAANATDPIHTATTAQGVYFDDAGPVVTISVDSKWYSRAATNHQIVVTATIVDAGSGLVATGSTRPFLTVNGNSSFGSNISGSTWTFTLDATQATDGTEGPLNFTITAVDAVGNSSSPGGSRNVDAKAPAISGVEVYLAGIADPAVGGVTYPATVAGTGYTTGRDGTHFIYSDSIHIKGTIADGGAGLFVTGLLYRIEGTTSGSGILQALTGTGCTDGSASCAFDIAAQALNDLARNGALNASIGDLTLVILAEDKAVAGDGTSAAHNRATPSSTIIATTRLWWSRQFPATAVAGVAIHPNGDAVVTTQAAAGVDTVFAQYPDGPFHAGGIGEHWQFGAGLYGASDLGTVSSAPAIGQGTSASALIYVASAGGDIVAINPAGTGTATTAVWKCGAATSGGFSASPAIATVPKLGNATVCEGVFVGSTDSSVYGACLSSTTPGSCTVKNLVLNDKVSHSTTVQGGKFYVPTDTSIAQLSLTANGAGFVAPAAYFPNSSTTIGPTTGTISAAGSLFSASINAGSSTAYSFTSAFTQRWATTITRPPQGQALIDATQPNGNVLIETTDKVLHVIDPTSGVDTPAPAATLGSSGYTPLLASDGRIYIGLDNSTLVALNGASLANPYAPQWTFSGIAAFTAAPAMDCNGTLYAAASDRLYALVTDAQGLASTPWPKYQRDSRNSGNGDVTTPWGVRTAPGPAGCVQ